ncbi:nucleoside diphosphate kinase homolog 5-like [Sycon ciliatum]|uniref:nucleoside diphosphate kinase homolog 5-like n=1 Tax=Sycon ciliatum TaxID=27933 RepID=UPI0020A9A618|eukprot:scpid57489/ scgid28985/ Nucleoside diphosphate kinase homolog 5; Inhibitor of p53-induced apoptosis-beta; Testis-specific nm23 homolog; nm23-H5
MEGPGIEKTLAILKPDVITMTSNMRELICQNGFRILRQRRLHLTAEQCAEFYQEHSGKSFFPRLCAYMSSGPVEVLVLGRLNSVEIWRLLMGPAKPSVAVSEAPGTLRARFGQDDVVNSFHGSESVSSAEREIHFFFSDEPLEPLTGQEAKEYLAKYVNPVLTEGLAELVRAKPRDPISFLAQYLDEHNPSLPSIEVPGFGQSKDLDLVDGYDEYEDDESRSARAGMVEDAEEGVSVWN